MVTKQATWTPLQWRWHGSVFHICTTGVNKICQVETILTTAGLCGSMDMIHRVTGSNKSKLWAKWERILTLTSSTNKKCTKATMYMHTWEETKFWQFWRTKDKDSMLTWESTPISKEMQEFATFYKKEGAWMLKMMDQSTFTSIMDNHSFSRKSESDISLINKNSF